MRTCLIACVLAGCGRLDFEPLIDAAPDAPPPCDLSAAFGPPVLVPGVSNQTYFEANLRLSLDELRGVLWYTATGGVDLGYATRPDLTSPFTVTPITELNTTSNEFEPTLSSDELVLIFQSSRAGATGGLDLFIAQRATTAQPFTLLGEITTINTVMDENQPFLTDHELYFSSNRAGDADLYRAQRTGPTTFAAPTRIDEVSQTGTRETDATLSYDEKTFYFGSDRDTGDIDLYTASRASTTGPFGPATRMASLSTPANEGPSWPSVDGCRLYISSANLGTPDIYVATKP